MQEIVGRITGLVSDQFGSHSFRFLACSYRAGTAARSCLQLPALRSKAVQLADKRSLFDFVAQTHVSPELPKKVVHGKAAGQKYPAQIVPVTASCYESRHLPGPLRVRAVQISEKASCWRMWLIPLRSDWPNEKQVVSVDLLRCKLPIFFWRALDVPDTTTESRKGRRESSPGRQSWVGLTR